MKVNAVNLFIVCFMGICLLTACGDDAKPQLIVDDTQFETPNYVQPSATEDAKEDVQVSYLPLQGNLESTIEGDGFVTYTYRMVSPEDVTEYLSFLAGAGVTEAEAMVETDGLMYYIGTSIDGQTISFMYSEEVLIVSIGKAYENES